MAYNAIYIGTFPYLDAHYDESDEGHTRGHADHFEALYDQSIDDAIDDNEREMIKEEKALFLEMVNKSPSEYFTLIP